MSNIDVVRKNLGHVTAYKYAVSKGFQGTEEEFAELMASYASIAQDVSAESRVAEGYALGKQNGVDVGDQSPYYHANAKYHAEQAAASASAAAASAQSLVIDGTLSQEGQAADAKAVGDEITELKSALNDATGCTVIQLSDKSLHQYIQTNGGVGTVVQWDTPFTMGNAGAWAVVDCVEGDKFTISGKGGDADRLWCFLDAEKKITRVAGSGTTSTNHILTARTDEVYLVINNRQDKTSYIGEVIPKAIDDIISRLNNSLELDNANAVSLSDTSLVDELAPGSYRVGSAAIASALNMPFAVGGKLYVFTMANNSRLMQLYFSENNLAIRYNQGSGYGNWSIFSKNAIESSGYILGTTTTPTPFTDFNNAPDNGIFAINRAQYDNAPPGDSTLFNSSAAPGYLRGILLTFTQSTTNPTYKAQIFIGYYSAITNTPPIITYRFAIKNNTTLVLDWSPWCKLSEPRSLHTTNVVIHAAYADQYFTDFNDAPINAMYQIDLDCVAGVIANHPAPGHSAVLHTFAWSVSSRHAVVQKLYSLQNGILVEYTRYGYQNTADDYRWTQWRKTVTEAVT